MSPEELKARARRIPEELLTQGDLSVADAVFAPDLIHHGPAPHAPGVTGVKEFALALRVAFPDLCAIVEDEIAEGDRVVQRLALSGTHRGEYRGLPPTGRRVTWQVVAIQRIGPDGKVAEHWSSPDLFGLLRQLGALPITETARGLGAAREDAA
jgi:predicted ester cyclase